MVRLITGKPSAALRKRALLKATSLEIPDSRRKKIGNIIQYSPYSKLFCQYLTSDDPVAFRQNLPVNVAFRKEATKYGLDLKVLREGIPDTGIELTFNHDSYASHENLSGFANHLFGLFNSSLSKLEEAVWSSSDHVDDNLDMEDAADRFALELEQHMDDHLTTIQDSASPDNFHETLSKARIGGLQGQYKQALLGIQKWYDKYCSQGNLMLTDLVKDPTKESINQTRDILLKSAEDLHKIISEYDNPKEPLISAGSVQNIIFHLRHYSAPTISGKVKKKSIVKYFVKLEELLPWDVTFGNDGGCCLAIYNECHPKDGLENAYALPVYQLHEGIPIFGIYQQIDQRQPARVGMSLGFHSISQQNSPTELLNSTELSESMNPLDEDGLNALINHVNTYLWNFSDAAGFKRLATGNHDYNTGFNYTSKTNLKRPDYGVHRLQLMPTTKNPPEFYSEVLERDGLTLDGTWSWITRPNSK